MDFIHHVLGPDLKAAFLIILNLILIEGLLSIDNAAVLATLVMGLPEKERAKALRLGLFIGYFLRGLCIVFVQYLMNIWWLKLLGGLYLVYLGFSHFMNKKNEEDTQMYDKKNESKIFTKISSVIGVFWATVINVELLDIVFSIDNVFAAVAFTNNIYLIILGVFIGILFMRFIASQFVLLMQKYPQLETSAFTVVLILGLKLCSDFPCSLGIFNSYCNYLEHYHEKINFIFSFITIIIFVIPILRGFLKIKN